MLLNMRLYTINRIVQLKMQLQTINRTVQLKNSIIYHQKCNDVAFIHVNLTQKTTNNTGLIFSHPLSNFSDDTLRTFVMEKPLNWKNNPPQFKSIGDEISEAVIELSTIRSNYTFSTTSDSNFTLLPTFGKCGINQDAKIFSTAIFVHNDQCSFPEKRSKVTKGFLDSVMKKIDIGRWCG